MKRSIAIGTLALLTACGGNSTPPPPGCSCPVALLYMAVAERGSGEIAIYQQLPATGAPVQTIAAPGAESFAYEPTVDTATALFVGEYPGSVAIFSPPYTKSTGTITQGISDPAALVTQVTNDGWLLYVANRGANTVSVFASSNLNTPSYTIGGLNGPNRLAFDPQGNLWVSQATNVVEFKPPFSASSTPAATISSGLQSPSGLGIDFTGNMYVSDKGKNAIVVYAAGSTTPSVTVTSGITAPGNPIVTAALLVPNASGSVVEFNLPLTPTSTPVASVSSGMNQPSAITFITPP
jgi:hypothetical protein